MQLASAYAPPIIIGPAAANKVFDALAAGPIIVEQVAETPGASGRGLHAIMNALVGCKSSA